MAAVEKSGGGEAGSVLVDDTGTIVVIPRNQNRNFVEIQNNDGLDGQPAARCHLRINNEGNAEYGKGIFLNPGGSYFMGLDNLSIADIKAVTDTGTTTTIYYQLG
jgi:hypothetical protein